MKFYMEAGVVASDFFSSAVPKSIYEDQVRMTYYIQHWGTTLRLLSSFFYHVFSPLKGRGGRHVLA